MSSVSVSMNPHRCCLPVYGMMQGMMEGLIEMVDSSSDIQYVLSFLGGRGGAGKTMVFLYANLQQSKREVRWFGGNRMKSHCRDRMRLI